MAKKRVQVGDVTGDRRLDALILDAGEIWLLSDPATQEAQIATGWQATDFAIAHPPTGPSPVQESEIFFVDANGIHFLSDYDAGSFTKTSRPSSLWNGAQRVVATDLGANGSTDLIGIGSDGSSILTARVILDASPVFTWFSVPSSVLDVAAADWQGTSAPEILVLLNSGLYVYDIDGNLLSTIPQVMDSGHLGVLRQTSFSFDRCAVVFRRGGMTYRWVADASLVEGAESLGASVISAIATADVDEDGADDLMVFGPNAGESWLSFNQDQRGSSSTFASGGGVTVGTGSLGRFQQAWPAIADFDNDGDEDFFFYATSGNDWTYYANTSIDADLHSPVIEEGTAVLDDTLPSVPVSLGLEVTVPGTRGFVEVLVWEQDANASFNNPTHPVPAFQGVFPVDSSRKAFPIIELGGYSSVSDTAYYIDLRSVDAEPAAGVMTAVGPSAVFVCVVGESVLGELASYYGEPLEQLQEDPPVDVFYASELGGSPVVSFSGREIGSVIIEIPNDDVPPFETPPAPDPDPTYY